MYFHITCVSALFRYVGKFVPRKDRIHNSTAHQHYTNVYVKNFGDDFDDEKLRQLFEKYGNIVSAVVMRDLTYRSRGFGFVSFETHDAAAKVCYKYCSRLYDRFCIGCRRYEQFNFKWQTNLLWKSSEEK